MIKKGFITIILSSFFTLAKATGGILTLDQVLQDAKSKSTQLQIADAQVESAESAAQAVQSARYPKLTLDANYRHQSVIPEMTIGTNKVKLTDDHAYSIGPTLSYILWDSGNVKNKVSGLESLAESKREQKKLSESQLILAVKLAYLQNSLTIENINVAKKALELSQSQNRDIKFRFKEGVISKVDALNSDSEVLNYDLRLQQVQNELESNKRDLEYFIGDFESANIELQSLKELINQIQNTQKELQFKATDESTMHHPLVKIQDGMAKFAQAQVESQKANNWPTLALQLRSSLDYPNGPKFEQINQNTLGINLTWNLYEFGATSNQISAKSAEAKVAAMNKEEAIKSLKRNTIKIIEKIKSINQQIADTEKLVVKQEELVKINYSTYKFGKLSFLEVQNANFRLLEANNRLNSLRAQFLNQNYNLQFLTGSK